MNLTFHKSQNHRNETREPTANPPIVHN